MEVDMCRSSLLFLPVGFIPPYYTSICIGLFPSFLMLLQLLDPVSAGVATEGALESIEGGSVQSFEIAASI